MEPGEFICKLVPPPQPRQRSLSNLASELWRHRILQPPDFAGNHQHIEIADRLAHGLTQGLSHWRGPWISFFKPWPLAFEPGVVGFGWRRRRAGGPGIGEQEIQIDLA